MPHDEINPDHTTTLILAEGDWGARADLIGQHVVFKNRIGQVIEPVVVAAEPHYESGGVLVTLALDVPFHLGIGGPWWVVPPLLGSPDASRDVTTARH